MKRAPLRSRKVGRVRGGCSWLCRHGEIKGGFDGGSPTELIAENRLGRRHPTVPYGPRDLTRLVFGPHYEPSGTVALFLCIGLLGQTILGLNYILLTMTGSHAIASTMMVLPMAGLAAAAIIGYPYLGVLGTAALTGVVLVAQNTLLAIVVRRRLGFLPFAFFA